jgi:hypothetical protein
MNLENAASLFSVRVKGEKAVWFGCVSRWILSSFLEGFGYVIFGLTNGTPNTTLPFVFTNMWMSIGAFLERAYETIGIREPGNRSGIVHVSPQFLKFNF